VAPSQIDRRNKINQLNMAKIPPQQTLIRLFLSSFSVLKKSNRNIYIIFSSIFLPTQEIFISHLPKQQLKLAVVE
jgi:hypothetical protein